MLPKDYLDIYLKKEEDLENIKERILREKLEIEKNKKIEEEKEKSEYQLFLKLKNKYEGINDA